MSNSYCECVYGLCVSGLLEAVNLSAQSLCNYNLLLRARTISSNGPKSCASCVFMFDALEIPQKIIKPLE